MLFKFSKILTEDIKKLRNEVFVLEQKFVEDFSDQNYLYCSAYNNGQIVGTLRGIIEDGVMTIGRFCIKKSYRGQHIGTNLLLFMEQKASKLGVFKIVISSQATAKDFYLRFGYEVKDSYLTQNVLHFKLVKEL